MSDLDVSEIVLENIPVVLSLVEAIKVVINSKPGDKEQLNALETAAEAIKQRLDEIKFPSESNG